MFSQYSSRIFLIYTPTFIFYHFGLKLPIRTILRQLGQTWVRLQFVSFSPQKSTPLCHSTCCELFWVEYNYPLFLLLSVIIRLGLCSLRWSEKNKKSQKAIFHPFAQKALINFGTFHLRVAILYEIEFPIFPQESDVAVVTVLRYGAMW